jgi:multiple sugar transport system permease protein
MSQVVPTAIRRVGPIHARVRWRQFVGVAASYLILGLGAALLLLPFVFMVSTSLKSMDQVFVFPIQWLPRPVHWDNYPRVFEEIRFLQFILNTVIITVFGILGSLVGSALAAYPFARLRFPGRNLLFMLMLATLMVPAWVTLIPQFLLFRAFGWIDTYLPFIVPAFAANPFYTFLMRQFFLTIPRELDDAARIDGAGSFRVLTRILLPLSKPALATVSIFAFLHYWNDFLGPLIYLSTPSKFTLAVGIAYFQGEFRTNFPLLMAAATMAMLPPLLVFFAAQRLFIEGVTMTGLKG